METIESVHLTKKRDIKHCPVTLHECKVLESLIRNSILDRVRKYNLIRESQHGFLREKNPIDVIYLDFQKTFDKVPHKRLMLKIYALEILGNAYNWTEECYKDREQRLVLLGSSC